MPKPKKNSLQKFKAVRIAQRNRTSFSDLAKKLARETGNGDELVDFAMEVFRGECPGSTKFSDRWEAFQWITDRMYGKAPQKIEIAAEETTKESKIDLSKLSDRELKKLADFSDTVQGFVKKAEPIDVG